MLGEGKFIQPRHGRIKAVRLGCFPVLIVSCGAEFHSRLWHFHSHSPPSSHWRWQHLEPVNYTNVQWSTAILFLLNVKFMLELMDTNRRSSLSQMEEINLHLKNLLKLPRGWISSSCSGSLVSQSAAVWSIQPDWILGIQCCRKIQLLFPWLCSVASKSVKHFMEMYSMTVCCIFLES